ncbi:MAG: S-layer homology domain-containing protein, partial [Candidatus Peribacteria bacterium]|nr:S-layer homology domain-containing protein [Candidatus Peribacteria bacterium]
EEARLNDTITRAEMAKVLTVFVSNSLSPSSQQSGSNNTIGGLSSPKFLAALLRNSVLLSGSTSNAPKRSQCTAFSDLNQTNAELQSYIIKACKFGLMGYYSDGKTVKPAFSPNATITLAEVATTLSRILRADSYQGTKQWRYHSHLLALQKVGIIPYNVDPMQPELRGTLFAMLMKS